MNNPLQAAEAHLTAQKNQFVRELDGFLQRDGILQPGQSVSNMGHNDTLDAVRHAYVTGRFADTYGGPVAEAIGREHEKRHPNDAAETAMDLHNNRMGAQYSGETHSPEALYNRIKQGVQNGELITAPQQQQQNGNYQSNAGQQELNDNASRLVTRIADATGNPDALRISAATTDAGMRDVDRIMRNSHDNGFIASLGNESQGNRQLISDASINRHTPETAVASLNQNLSHVQAPASIEEAPRSRTV
jgi:hypothetical protein